MTLLSKATYKHFSTVDMPTGAFQGEVSCPKTCWHVDSREWDRTSWTLPLFFQYSCKTKAFVEAWYKMIVLLLLMVYLSCHGLICAAAGRHTSDSPPLLHAPVAFISSHGGLHWFHMFSQLSGFKLGFVESITRPIFSMQTFKIRVWVIWLKYQIDLNHYML